MKTSRLKSDSDTPIEDVLKSAFKQLKLTIGNDKFGRLIDFQTDKTIDSVKEEIKLETRQADLVREGEYIYILGEPFRVKQIVKMFARHLGNKVGF